MNSWGSYPSIFALGHKAIADLHTVEVNVEEKVDGSQFSFGLVETNYDVGGNPVDPIEWADTAGVKYSLKVRSKGAVMVLDAPEAMFSKACETVKRLRKDIRPGWTYRGEVLGKPKHNSLVYDRVPRSPCPACAEYPSDACVRCNGTKFIDANFILFDVNTGNQEFLSYEAKAEEAHRLGLEVVPRLFYGRIHQAADVRRFLETESILGGQKIEGVVVKPRDYGLYGQDKKVLMGKFVSEAFKEVHRKAWGESNPSNKDIFDKIREAYCTQARWNKAIIHLREAGQIHDVVQDIGPIMKAVPEDVLKECEGEIKDVLWKYAWPHIRRGLTYGLPQWYKEELLKQQFEREALVAPHQPSEDEVAGGSPADIPVVG